VYGLLEATSFGQARRATRENHTVCTQERASAFAIRAAGQEAPGKAVFDRQENEVERTTQGPVLKAVVRDNNVATGLSCLASIRHPVGTHEDRQIRRPECV
jgi:hypothetical protein